MAEASPCPCGGDDDDGGCMFVDFGYHWCRVCEEHHRSGECAIDSEGRALAPCGCLWFECVCE